MEKKIIVALVVLAIGVLALTGTCHSQQYVCPQSIISAEVLRGADKFMYEFISKDQVIVTSKEIVIGRWKSGEDGFHKDYKNFSGEVVFRMHLLWDGSFVLTRGKEDLIVARVLKTGMWTFWWKT